MSILSMFYGIVAYMNFYDMQRHNLPHFHVEYAEHTSVVAIQTGEVLAA